MLGQYKKLIKYLINIIVLSTLIYIVYLLNKEQIYEDRLIDVNNFKYLIENDICNEHDTNLLGIILVTSYAGNTELRSAHRSAISQQKLVQLKLLRIFLTGIIPKDDKSILQNQLIDEQTKYNDLIQGNFIDVYRNLSYKTGMGFKWAVTKCSKAQYIIKTGDDIVFDVYYIAHFLKNFHIKVGYSDEFIAGHIHTIIRVEQSEEETFFISLEDDIYDNYPHFLLGMFYMTNPWTAKKLIIASQKSEYYGIENAFFTGILRSAIKCPIYNLNNWYTKDSTDLYSCIKDMRERGYKCYYYVGPNDGDTRLIVQYIKSIEKCQEEKCVHHP